MSTETPRSPTTKVDVLASIGRLLDAAHIASELLDGCPDDEVSSETSTELSEAAAAVDIAAVAELIEAAR